MSTVGLTDQSRIVELRDLARKVARQEALQGRDGRFTHTAESDAYKLATAIENLLTNEMVDRVRPNTPARTYQDPVYVLAGNDAEAQAYIEDSIRKGGASGGVYRILRGAEDARNAGRKARVVMSGNFQKRPDLAAVQDALRQGGAIVVFDYTFKGFSDFDPTGPETEQRRAPAPSVPPPPPSIPRKPPEPVRAESPPVRREADRMRPPLRGRRGGPGS